MWTWILTVWILLQFLFFVASMDARNDTDLGDVKDASYRKNENMTQEMDLFLFNKSRSRLSITPYHEIEIKRRYAIEKYEKGTNGVKFNDTEESGVKFEEGDYDSSKTIRDSVGRKMNPKIEKLRLGKVHFSSEVMLNYDVNKNKRDGLPEVSKKHFTPKSDFLRQNYDGHEIDYKLPDDEYDSRKTTPIEDLLTSAAAPIFTTHPRTRPQSSTTISFKRDFHQERILMKMGPFTFFIYKVMEFLAAKRPSKLTKEITDEFRDVSLKLYKERINLFEFGEPFNRGVKEFFTNIRPYEADTLQRMAAIFHKALPKRWELFSVEVNVLYERIDALYLPKEVDRMYELLLELKIYPRIGRNATNLVTTILVDVIVDPFTREGPSERRMEMLTRLNVYVSVTYYDRKYMHVPGPEWQGVDDDFEEMTNDPGLPPQLWTTKTRTYTTPYIASHLTADMTNMNAGNTPNLETMSNPTFEVILVTTSVNARGTPRLETKSTSSFEVKGPTNSEGKIIARFNGKGTASFFVKSTPNLKTKATTRSEVKIPQDLRMKTIPVGRSATKNGYKQARDSFDHERTFYKESHTDNNFDFEQDEIFSINNNNFSEKPKNYIENPGFGNNMKYESNKRTTYKKLKEKLIKSRQNLFKGKSPLNYSGKAIHSDENLNSEEEKELKIIFNNFNKETTSSKSTDLGKLWNEAVEANNDRDKNMKGEEHLSRELRFVSKTESRPKLHNEELKRKLMTDHIENINDAIRKETTTQILRNSIKPKEINNSLSINKTNTDSFLDLLLKLDGLVNSGEGGLLDEIMKEKDAAVQKIDSDNEKFLENEAAEKLFRGEESQVNIMTKKYMQETYAKQTRKGENKEHGKVQTTKRHKANAYNDFKNRQYSTIRSSIGEHIKNVLREQQNVHSSNTPARVQKTRPSEKKSGVTNKHYINTMTTLRNKVKYQTSSRAHTKWEIFSESDISREQSREWAESHTSRTSEQKYKTFQITFRKPSSKEKNYTTKKSKGKFIKDKITKKSIKTKTPLKELKKGYTSKKVTQYHTVKEPLRTPKNFNIPVKTENKEKLSSHHHDMNIEILFQNTKIQPQTKKYKNNKVETYANGILSDKLKKTVHEKVNSVREVLTTKEFLRYRPPERINKKFQQEKEEQRKDEERKERNRKRKHFKYTPDERFVTKGKQNNKGHLKKKVNKQQRYSSERSSNVDDYNTMPKGKQFNNAHSKKIINNQYRESQRSNSYQAGDETTNADINIYGDSDNAHVWNVTNSMEKSMDGSMEKKVEVSSGDDYYYVQGQGKIIFKGDLGKTYELKKSKKEQNIGRNRPMSKFDKIQGKMDVSSEKDKTDFFIIEKKNSRQPAKGGKNDSTELTELLVTVSDIEELLGEHLVGFKHKHQYPDEDFDDPINEYTLKPTLKSNTENEVPTITTPGIFEELKQMKNRLFHQDFRRGMSRRKNKITLNELFFKNKSQVKKITEESSYSDEENNLKSKLQEALRQNSTINNK